MSNRVGIGRDAETETGTGTARWRCMFSGDPNEGEERGSWRPWAAMFPEIWIPDTGNSGEQQKASAYPLRKVADPVVND